MPLPAVLGLLLVQVGALVVGFFGPPVGRVRPILTALLLGSGLLLLPLGFVAVALGAPQTGTLMVWSGVLLFASAARLVRGPDNGEDDDGGGGGGSEGPDEPPPQPPGPGFDWEAFDREREGWAARPPVASAPNDLARSGPGGTRR